MTCFGIVRRVWRWLRPGQIKEIENTTTLGVSQEAVSESNQKHSSPIPSPERSSDQTPPSQTSLCSICAHGLRLDDRCAKGVLEEPCNDDLPKLSFPLLSQDRFPGTGWHGGAQYEQRDITPPHLPELSDKCKFCRAIKSKVLKHGAEKEWWQTTASKLTLQVQYKWVKLKEEDCQLHFGLWSLDVLLEHPRFYYWLLQFPIATSSGSCQEWLHITARPLDVESSFSETKVDLIRNWLLQCETDPSCCRFSKREEFLPTRLLDVGAHGSDDLQITLVDTRSMDQLRYEDRPLKYICLSYCWGAGQPPLRTTKSTIEGHKAGVPIDSMPRVFRDAVLVARTLGVRYLWIDALCIVQGCDEDWHNESAAMADVFSNSWMTIGAAATSSCHETLFYPREDLSIDIEFQSSIKRNITGTISILLLSEYTGTPLAESLQSSTWNTRGWVWQEQKLPQRLLIFGEKMLHFRCHQRMLHEYERHHVTRTDDCKGVSVNGAKEWESVMYHYSHRELTKGRDRLAAISGFVKAVAQEHEDAGNPATYIAGIWLAENARVNLQLSWFLEHPTISFRRLLRYHSDRQQYIAPSWSWAALNQPVDILYSGGQPVFQVVTYNIKPARSDPTVAIAHGSSITLLGKLRNIPGRPSMGLKSSRSGTSATWWEAPYSGNENPRRWKSERKQNVDRKIKYVLDWVPSPQDFIDGLEAHLKLFLLTKYRQNDGRSALGLILFPVDMNTCSFLRVGCFEIYGPWKSPDWEETEVVLI